MMSQHSVFHQLFFLVHATNTRKLSSKAAMTQAVQALVCLPTCSGVRIRLQAGRAPQIQRME